MNDFISDDAMQRKMRDEVLVPGFYEKYYQGRYILLDRGSLALMWQKEFAIDTIVQPDEKRVVTIEEKIVRWKGRVYDAFSLETRSCTVPGHEKTGWMFYGQADFLLYCCTTDGGDLRCWLIDFPKLQEWFWPRETFWPSFQKKEQNRTAGRVVPITDICKAVWTRHYMVKRNAH